MTTHPAHVAAEKARDALNRLRNAEYQAGAVGLVHSPTGDRAAREVTAAIATLVKLATGVESQPCTDWAEERTS
jgi:hypothetical protein